MKTLDWLEFEVFPCCAFDCNLLGMMLPLLTARTPSSARKEPLLDVKKRARKAPHWSEADLTLVPPRKV